ncbi:MAG: hypothetical protein PHR25_02920 [Clostridia bacterium]|nr:hypothetical protein [Clostridia bacterium]MDD4375712.1 hypothetical protein [Clostridia bacterium]
MYRINTFKALVLGKISRKRNGSLVLHAALYETNKKIVIDLTDYLFDTFGRTKFTNFELEQISAAIPNTLKVSNYGSIWLPTSFIIKGVCF